MHPWRMAWRCHLLTRISAPTRSGQGADPSFGLPCRGPGGGRHDRALERMSRRPRCTARRQGAAPAHAPCCLASSTTLAPVSPLDLWRATSPTLSPGDCDWEHAMVYEDGDWMLLRSCGGCSSPDLCNRMRVI